MRLPRQGFAFAAVLATAASVAVAATPAANAYYERALMHAADARCHIFTPDLASALGAAQAQARGAALRGGATSRSLLALAGQADARQAALACNSRDLAIAAGRVKTAFEGYSHLMHMSYPGDDAPWQADRSLPMRTPIWRLSQSAASALGPVTFGLAGDYSRPATLLAVADFGAAGTPYAAQLFVRDIVRAPEPYLQAVSIASWARLPLAERAPPRSAVLVFAAEQRADADRSLLPRGSTSAQAFRFPPAAAQALTQLDPREAATLVFLFQDRSGPRVSRAYVEVGDFAAGEAFLAATPR